MKLASLTSFQALATSQYFIANLYQFTLQSQLTSPYYYTDSDYQITTGGHTWGTGLTINRDSFKQERGFKVQELKLTITPQQDASSTALFNGTPFLQAIRLALFDSALVSWYKIILPNGPSGYGGQFPLTGLPAPILWFQGMVDDAQAGRLTGELNCSSFSTLLSMQMPRNVMQPGCIHTLGDGGCTIAVGSAPYTIAGTVATNVSGTTNNDITSTSASLINIQPTDYFSLGIIKFTSGSNNGVTRTIRRFIQNTTSVEVQFVNPPPALIAPGDTFTLQAGCDKSYTTCNTRFSNTLHYKGFPFVPVPETMYDGGSGNYSAPSQGGQLGGLTGTGPGGRGFKR